MCETRIEFGALGFGVQLTSAVEDIWGVNKQKEYIGLTLTLSFKYCENSYH